MFEVNTSLIRFWQKEFPIYLKPKINARGKRFFHPSDVVNFSKIYALVKVQGFTLDGARAKLKATIFQEATPSTKTTNHEATKEQIIHRLTTLKERLAHLSK